MELLFNETPLHRNRCRPKHVLHSPSTASAHTTAEGASCSIFSDSIVSNGLSRSKRGQKREPVAVHHRDGDVARRRHTTQTSHLLLSQNTPKTTTRKKKDRWAGLPPLRPSLKIKKIWVGLICHVNVKNHRCHVPCTDRVFPRLGVNWQ